MRGEEKRRDGFEFESDGKAQKLKC